MQRKPWKGAQWLTKVVGNRKLDPCVPKRESLVPVKKLQQLVMLNDGLCYSTDNRRGFQRLSQCFSREQHLSAKLSCTTVWVTTLWHSLPSSKRYLSRIYLWEATVALLNLRERKEGTWRGQVLPARCSIQWQGWNHNSPLTGSAQITTTNNLQYNCKNTWVIFTFREWKRVEINHIYRRGGNPRIKQYVVK